MGTGMTHRCMWCGCPTADHIALRYALRAWLGHASARIRRLRRG